MKCAVHARENMRAVIMLPLTTAVATQLFEKHATTAVGIEIEARELIEKKIPGTCEDDNLCAR